jgi:ElaB/YqjD/DUF883 family membrane-anchored ribosome-binding protein
MLIAGEILPVVIVTAGGIFYLSFLVGTWRLFRPKSLALAVLNGILWPVALPVHFIGDLLHRLLQKADRRMKGDSTSPSTDTVAELKRHVSQQIEEVREELRSLAEAMAKPNKKRARTEMVEADDIPQEVIKEAF